MLYKNKKFQDVQHKNKYTIIIAYADWCGACKMLKPVLAEIEKKRQDVDVYEINVETNQDFVLANDIEGTPTTFIFKDGKNIDRILGFVPETEIVKRLK